MKKTIIIGIVVVIIILIIAIPLIVVYSIPKTTSISPSVSPVTPTVTISPVSGLLGLAYDTGILTTTNPDEIKACILQDLLQIKASGYTAFRTYFPKYGFQECDANANTGLYAELAQTAGLKVLLGVAQESYETYKTCIIRQLREFPETVLGVAIGNESVQDTTNWAGLANAIIATSQDIKSIVPTARTGTVQQSGFGMCAFAGICTDLCNQQCQEAYQNLMNQLDFVGFNVYPGSEGGPAIATSDAAYNKLSTYTQLDALYENVPSGKLWIGESGMPWSGSCNNGQGNLQVFTRELQLNLLQDIKDWQHSHQTVPTFVFMAFDVPSKQAAPGCPSGNDNAEAHFGVELTQTCSN